MVRYWYDRPDLHQITQTRLSSDRHEHVNVSTETLKVLQEQRYSTLMCLVLVQQNTSLRQRAGVQTICVHHTLSRAHALDAVVMVTALQRRACLQGYPCGCTCKNCVGPVQTNKTTELNACRFICLSGFHSLVHTHTQLLISFQ